MLVCLLLFDVIFDHCASCSKWISDIQDLDDNIRAVDDFVQLVPDPFALPGSENIFPCHLFLFWLVSHQVSVLFGVIV